MTQILIIMLIGLVTIFAYQSLEARGQDAGDDRAWGAALAQADGPAQRVLINLSRPLASTAYMQSATSSKQYEFLERKVKASGGVFGGSVEVFLCVEAMACFLAAVIMGLAIGFGVGGLAVGVILMLALAVAYYPYDTVNREVKKRGLAIQRELPEFAELLQMPLTSGGYGIIPALGFTAQRLQGPVSQEVRAMLDKMRARPGSEEEEFKEAAARLGTPEAVSFFNALAQAQLQGAKVSENLAAQAEALRVQQYQYQRGENRKLPVRLVLIFAIHLLPLLFIAPILPTIVSLKGLGGSH